MDAYSIIAGLIGGIEIEMSILAAFTFDALHENALSFLNDATLPFGDRLLIESFLDRNQLELNCAAKYLSLPAPGKIYTQVNH